MSILLHIWSSSISYNSVITPVIKIVSVLRLAFWLLYLLYIFFKVSLKSSPKSFNSFLWKETYFPLLFPRKFVLAFDIVMVWQKGIAVFSVNWDIWNYSDSFKSSISNFMVKSDGILPFGLHSNCTFYILTGPYVVWPYIGKDNCIPNESFHASALRSETKMNHTTLHRRYVHRSITLDSDLKTVLYTYIMYILNMRTNHSIESWISFPRIIQQNRT